MTLLDRSITNESVIPVLETAIFHDHPMARFAVGILAVGDMPVAGLEQEYGAYYDLRRKVYFEQTGQLAADDIAEDGTDRDSDDSRSVAFGIIENRGEDQRVVATARLIVKGMCGNDDPLPVEQDWPEVFTANPTPKGSLEVSRLISRHEKAGIQEINKGRLYDTALAYVLTHDLGPAYAIVEEWFERDLRRFVPVTRVGEPVYVPKYLDTNVALEIDVPELARRSEQKNPGSLAALRAAEGQMLYYGKLAQASTAA